MSSAPGSGVDRPGTPQGATAPYVIRAFYALWPEPAIAEALLALSRSLPLKSTAQPQALDRLHMTVAFVGNVSADRLDVLREVGRRQCARTVALRLDGYEYWPKPEVVVAVAREVPPALTELWDALHRELADRQFELTPKPLRPHVTLARKVMQAPVLPPLSPVTWRARRLSLVLSARVETQLVYTVVDGWPLLDS